MVKFVCEYKYENRHAARHTWTCIGRHGALHLHISKYGERDFQGGLEVHYRQPPDYMAGDAPSHEKCWLLGSPCWHDGSSLFVSENSIPYWQSDPTNHDRMFAYLQREFEQRFNPEDAA